MRRREDKAFKFGAHLVEGRRQFAELILRPDGDALAQITRSQRTDRGGEIADGMGERPGQNDAEDKCEGQAPQGGVEQRDVGAREVANLQAADGARIPTTRAVPDANLTHGHGHAAGERRLRD